MNKINICCEFCFFWEYKESYHHIIEDIIIYEGQCLCLDSPNGGELTENTNDCVKWEIK